MLAGSAWENHNWQCSDLVLGKNTLKNLSQFWATNSRCRHHSHSYMQQYQQSVLCSIVQPQKHKIYGALRTCSNFSGPKINGHFLKKNRNPCFHLYPCTRDDKLLVSEEHCWSPLSIQICCICCTMCKVFGSKVSCFQPLLFRAVYCRMSGGCSHSLDKVCMNRTGL